MKLSDLAGPDAAGWADVAVFVRADGSESEPFLFVHNRNGKLSLVQNGKGRNLRGQNENVRRLGRGRLRPPCIVMAGEATDLSEQVRLLREALELIRDVPTMELRTRSEHLPGTAGYDDAWNEFFAFRKRAWKALTDALAATAPTPTEERA